MTCQQMGDVVICRPNETIERRIMECPTCERRRRFVVSVFEWYDPIARCCGCGDAWEGGWRMERPFRRGWRADAIRRAKVKWNA